MNDRPSVRVHQLPEFEAAGYAPSYEYYLPVRDMADADRLQLGNWLGNIATMTSEETTTVLRERWTNGWHARICDIFNEMLKYVPNSIVICGSRAWIHLQSSTKENVSYLVPEPTPKSVFQSRLFRHGFHDPLLNEFVTALSGLREDFEPSGDGFLRADEEFHFFVDPSWDSIVKDFTQWRGALQLFGALNGDLLLVRPDGRLGWFRGETAEMLEYAQDIEEACAKFTAYQRVICSTEAANLARWQFDSFWPIRV